MAEIGAVNSSKPLNASRRPALRQHGDGKELRKAKKTGREKSKKWKRRWRKDGERMDRERGE